MINNYCVGQLLNITKAILPSEQIYRGPNLYLNRWHIVRDKEKGNVYLHEFLMSDPDSALHCHPFDWSSVILKGSYKEVTKEGFKIKVEGDITFRRGDEPHRIELINNEPVYTLFTTGPKYRDWGFYCPDGFIGWEKFIEKDGC